MKRMTVASVGSLVLTFVFEYLLVYNWLGYPLVPGTVTNNFWELAWLNGQIVLFTVLFFIPAFLAAIIFVTLIGSVVFGIEMLVRLVIWRWRNEI